MSTPLFIIGATIVVAAFAYALRTPSRSNIARAQKPARAVHRRASQEK